MKGIRFTRTAIAAAWITAAGAVAVSGHSAATEPPRIQWLGSQETALARSLALQKPVLVDVWATWCAKCKVMATRTWGDPRIVKATNLFVPLRVNAADDERFASEYGASILPTTLFLDHEGRLLLKISGVVGPVDLARIMRQVLTGYDDYLNYLKAPDSPNRSLSVASYLVRIGNSRGAVHLLRRHLERLRSAAEVDEQQVELAELSLAKSLVADGRSRQAVPILRRLAVTAASNAVQGQALFGLVHTQRSRGEILEAEKAMKRLEKEFPELAAGLAEFQ